MAFLSRGKYILSSLKILQTSRHLLHTFTFSSRSSGCVLSANQRTFSTDFQNIESNIDQADTPSLINSHSKKVGKYQKKLHNRVFDDLDREEHRKLKESFGQDTDTGNIFGSYSSHSEENAERIHAHKATHFSKDNDIPTNFDNTDPLLTFTEKNKGVVKPVGRINDTKVHEFSLPKRKSSRRNDWSNKFGTEYNEDDLLERIEESLTSSVGTHDERSDSDCCN